MFLIPLIASCASVPAISPDYNGPIATIQETTERVDSGKAKMFFLENINGTFMRDSSAWRSKLRSSGQGNSLTIVDSPYSIEARPQVYTITGQFIWAMDGRGMIEKSLRVSGDVEFAPKEGVTYLINGSISAEESIVWIKDLSTDEIIAKFKTIHSN